MFLGTMKVSGPIGVESIYITKTTPKFYNRDRVSRTGQKTLVFTMLENGRGVGEERGYRDRYRTPVGTTLTTLLYFPISFLQYQGEGMGGFL